MLPTPPLTDIELRILGALIEKQVTTPDAYPLSMGALTAACNQLSNRDPILHLDEESITPALVALRRRGWLRAIQPSGARVTKYQQLMSDVLELDARELAVLDVLMLRGPQTLGELVSRTARLADFADAAAVDATLEALALRQPEPLVTRLPRRPGQKEARLAHLLGGAVTSDAATDTVNDLAGLVDAEAPSAPVEDTRVVALKHAVEELRAELAAIRDQFTEFRRQFE